MIRVDEWTDFEAHDLAELALSAAALFLSLIPQSLAQLSRPLHQASFAAGSFHPSPSNTSATTCSFRLQLMT